MQNEISKIRSLIRLSAVCFLLLLFLSAIIQANLVMKIKKLEQQNHQQRKIIADFLWLAAINPDMDPGIVRVFRERYPDAAADPCLRALMLQVAEYRRGRSKNIHELRRAFEACQED